MGGGSYKASDWTKLKTSRKIDSSSVDQIFKSRKMDDKFNPKFIQVREARDSEEHPNSTPIAIGVDVTGSMGYLSSEIIKNSLNELMKKLYSTKLVEDPQLMFAAIGDTTDEAPLQVTQFESDIRIAEQLMELWIEGAGGDSPEDYQLLWYFLAKHTDIDCFNKRGKKGFCFTIGDAAFHDSVTGGNIKAIFNDDAKLYRTSELAKMASEKYELFHIDLNAGKMSASKYIPGRVISVSPSEVKYLPEIIIAAIQLISGKTNDDILNGLDFSAKQVVSRAVSTLNVGGSIKL
ncbi:MAG: hypothetical protein IIZ41_09915 [Lachnospiraceae bacterium]|jgi:hypothetical protein|nr:hypothetical protein [Lachnospiraceae bacterium]MBQ6638847.1 hypothetical protein [Lachnospiraceae bacterium]MBR3636416.1 hypothetical protein [Lachnospiraceae bacterium]